MIAGKTQRFSNHVTRAKNRNDANVLKSAVVYGANASGKSNFVKAMFFAQRMILEGLENGDTNNKHFRLDSSNLNKISNFEFEFKHNGEIYAYGFDIFLSKKRIIEEWLYRTGKNEGDEKRIFERKTKENGEVEVSVDLNFSSAKDRNRIHYIGLDTKPNQLFLSELQNRNISQIVEIKFMSDIFHWFEDKLTIIFPDTRFGLIDFVGTSSQLTQNFCEFLDFFGTGVKGIRTETLEFESELKHIPEKIRKEIAGETHKNMINVVHIDGQRYSTYRDKNDALKIKRLMTKHIEQDTMKEVLFEIGEESDGTIRLFDLIPLISVLKNTDKVVIIDELDRSLHPILSRTILKTFLEETSGSNSQLIVTTHESSLLDLNLFRRDTIWFTEKDKFGATRMYSLEEYKPRHDKNVRKGYLLGRFGGIPFISDVKELSWLSEENPIKQIEK